MTDFKKIKLGLDFLIERDSYLLKNNLDERSMTHKLGEYYQIIFHEWNVDCEYNRNLGEPKKMEIDLKKSLFEMAIYLEKIKGNLADNVNKNRFFSKKYIDNLVDQLKSPKIEYIKTLNRYIFKLMLVKGEVVEKDVTPDIIVHHRGLRENNIVFEVKKTTSSLGEEQVFDLLKLSFFVSSLDYKYKKGIFINLPTGEDFYGFEKFKKEITCFDGVYKYIPLVKGTLLDISKIKI